MTEDTTPVVDDEEQDAALPDADVPQDDDADEAKDDEAAEEPAEPEA